MEDPKLLNRAKRDYGQLIAQADEAKRGQLSCDLAEDFWTGRLSPEELILLLKHSSSFVRSAALFAALDQCRLNDAAKFLLEGSFVDINPLNRRQLAAFIKRCNEIPVMAKRNLIERFEGDTDIFVQKICQSILALNQANP
jgi:hypothetical protein